MWSFKLKGCWVGVFNGNSRETDSEVSVSCRQDVGCLETAVVCVVVICVRHKFPKH